MTQLVVQIEDLTLLPQIRNAIELLKGVGNVVIKKTERKTELDKAIEEAKSGKILHAHDVNDLMAQLNG